MRLNSFSFLLGITLLIGVEFARVYFIMPFPGSQQYNSVDLAYFLNTYLTGFRIVGLVLAGYPAYSYLRNGTRLRKWLTASVFVLWLTIAFLVTYRLQADKIFYEQKKITLLPADLNRVLPQQLVLGVSLNNESTAYPIEIIGYHHQVRDSVGGEAILVTYCTVCRTGRVYSPVVNGVAETFRLVGMDHFNAMFEDSRTKSWWRQVNGEAITGSLKGSRLAEIPAEQMTLAAWITRHPNTRILQPDSTYVESYNKLKLYDEGKSKSKLTGTDSLSWQPKSWVVGLKLGNSARAYDWIELKQAGLVNDRLSGESLLVALEPDTASFHVWLRPDTLLFVVKDKQLRDLQTSSTWDWTGLCVEGPLEGNSLKPVQSYREFWHSWKTFNPNTTRYQPESN